MSQLAVTEPVWSDLQDHLRDIFSPEHFETWFRDLDFQSFDGSTLVLAAKNDFAQIWITDNYHDLMRDRACAFLGTNIELRIEVPGGDEGLNGAREVPVDETPDSPVPAPRVELPERHFPRVQFRGRNSQPLNPRNTFDNFIVGGSNQLAHAASLAVANNPGISYNPLFLYGDTGLGKTHLMHAVAHQIVRDNPNANVVYVSCEHFTNEFMRAIQDNSLVKFRRFYRNVDVLLIDDIQFLQGKERTQEEFFHTFNELFESQHQVCLSSDRPASEIPRLESRLVSRFQWGMVTDIQAPDLETRVAIIRKKAQNLNFELPPDVLQFLAQRITRNVRRMEGALLKVATYANLVHEQLTLETVERLVRDILEEEASRQISIERIQRKVCERYDLRMSDMTSKRRPANIAFPRQVAMYLSRLLTQHPLKEIGEHFGKRDHGTVIHAVKTVENVMETSEDTRHAIECLKKQIQSGA